MKKNYLIVMIALVCNFAMAQVQQTSYKGAFAPSPTPMWTAGWTNFDPNNAVYGTPTVQVSADVTSNTTWTSGNIYQLNGLINVRNNATLTIQPGTIIRSSQVASALVITRGAKLNANGTAANPIVFTSNKAAGSRLRGDWGGILILGKARYNVNNGVNFIEGLTQTVLSQFGGGTTPDDNDNSGILRYVRIEFAGFVFSPNNELNGLTMGAVGRGTTIENIQVSYSNDDSFEWFGGSVNCKNLVAFAGLDDDFDVDNGYKGIVQFGLAVKDPAAADISTSEIFEVDNNADGNATDTAANPWADFTSPIFSNITCIGANARPGAAAPAPLHDKALRLRRASRANIFNSIFLDSRRGLSIESVSGNAAYNATTPSAIFKNNTIASPITLVTDSAGANGANAATQAWFGTSGNVAITTNGTTTTSAGILASPYHADDASNYKLVGEGNGTIDYRPSNSDATNGASFTDSKISTFVAVGDAPTVTPVFNYCTRVIAPALTANLTADGVSLRWFTRDRNFKLGTTVAGDAKDVIVNNPDGTQTITVNGVADNLIQNVDTFTETAPVPSTSAVGTRYFYVAEVNALGAVSKRAQIRVNVIGSPTVALLPITGPTMVNALGATVPVTDFGSYVGTATTATFTVPASAEIGVTSYFWTLPLGVNEISGQGTNTIIVNFANVPAGVLRIGNIGVQARNAASCGGAIKNLAISARLPAAPRLVMNDPALPLRMVTVGAVTTSTPVSVSTFAKYMGTTTPVALVASPVVGASSYVWELPTGVNILNGTLVSTTTRFYNLFPFVGLGSATAPTTGGNVFYAITTTLYADGTRYTTGRIKRNPRNANPALGITAIAAFDNELTNVTNEGVVVNPAYPITSSTSNTINVNFAGVTSANSNPHTSVSGVPTNALRIGVKSVNGVGTSVTSNTASTLVPLTTSTAAQLRLTAVRPAAPKLVGLVAGLCPGVSYNYTITPSALASSYAITAPTGSVVTSASNMTNTLHTLSTSDLTFAVVYPAGFVANTSSSLQTLSVNAVNGIGASTAAVILKLSTLIPAVGTVTSTGGITQFNQNLTAKVFTVATNPLFTSYTWSAGNGAVIVSGQGTSSITINFSGVPVTTLSAIITVVGNTACGTSAPRAITLRYNVTAARLASDELTVNTTEVYPNPVSSEFNVDVTASNAGTLEIAIYSLDGTLVVSPKAVKLQEGANTITENVSSLKAGIYILQLVNASNNEVITKKLIKK